MGKSTYETARSLDVPEDQLHLIDAYFWDYFGKYASDPVSIPAVFLKTKEVLKFLTDKGIKLGVVTSNQASSISELLEKAHLRKYFETVVGSEHTQEKKPSPDPLNFALKAMRYSENIGKKEVWFVGDTEFDILAAHALGITGIGIAQEHTKPGLIRSKPEFIVDTMADFYDFLLSTEIH